MILQSTRLDCDGRYLLDEGAFVARACWGVIASWSSSHRSKQLIATIIKECGGKTIRIEGQDRHLCPHCLQIWKAQTNTNN